MRLKQKSPRQETGSPFHRIWNRLTNWDRSPVITIAKRARTRKQVRKMLEKSDVYGVVKLGRQAVRPLIQLLKDLDDGVRRYAAEALGGIGDKKAVRPLIKLLEDPNELVRASAVDALGKLKNAKAVEPLIQLLKDPDEWVRTESVIALGELKDVKAVKPLIPKLNDQKEEMRTRTKDALIKLAELHPNHVSEEITAYINGRGGNELLPMCGPNTDAANAMHEILLKCGEAMENAA